MTLIEGFGDEVIQFVGVLLVAIVAVLAWLSTNARPGRYRTVVVMRPRQHQPVTVSFRPRPNFMIADNQSANSQQVSTPETVVSPTQTVEEPSDASRVIPLQEMDSIIDADMAMMNNNRLHFYRRLDAPGSVHGIVDPDDESEAQEESEPASNEQIREMDSIVNAMEADATDRCDFFTRPNDTNPTIKRENNVASTASDLNEETEETEDNENSEGEETDSDTEIRSIEIDSRRILIKLKYINDTLKEVEGSLDELLKDFKWRHFSTELSSECHVRLIFNGRVLGDESATLRACGLHDQAVVHCIVHPKRNNAQRVEEGAGAAAGGDAAPERTWDFENILMTLMSISLTVVWFFRCEYSNMFTASASVALFGLTIFYSVAIFGLYFTDTFQINPRPTQPQPIPEN